MKDLILQVVRSGLRRGHSLPRDFQSRRGETVPAAQLLEEETCPAFNRGSYYPLQIGHRLGVSHQIVGKLGYGPSSTTWLARDLRCANPQPGSAAPSCRGGREKEHGLTFG